MDIPEQEYYLAYKKKQKQPQHWNGKTEPDCGIDPYDGKEDVPFRDIFTIKKNPFYHKDQNKE